MNSLVMMTGALTTTDSKADVLHFDVCLKKTCVEKMEDVRQIVDSFLSQYPRSSLDFMWERSRSGVSTSLKLDGDFVLKNIEYIKCEDQLYDKPGSKRAPGDLKMTTHIFSLNMEEPGVEELSVGDEEAVSAASLWELPNINFSTLWESLYYEGETKWRLVRYVETMLLFSDKLIDQNIITYNRVVLLHGPPGTGKTSLCKALAQRLSIRLDTRYDYCQLVEINSHSLFSRWFSESGKLVMKMFDKIRTFYEDPKCLVFILIDEVESLAAARKSGGNASEPSDAIRVVNAMLTQLDSLKHQQNVVVFTTSNITGSIDIAFIDRADIKQFIGLPGQKGIYSILHSCVVELMTRSVIVPHENLLIVPEEDQLPMDEMSSELFEISGVCCGLSGRTIRKLPFLAVATYIDGCQCTLQQFLYALRHTILLHKRQNDEVNGSFCTNMTNGH